MTKVIKEEFEKLESLKISDDSFTCNISLENFHNEFNRISRMDDDLFTYEVEIPGLASVPCNLNKGDDSKQQMTHGSDVDMEYDPSNVESTKWSASKFYNHKTMDQYTKNALWIYWTSGNDEVKLTDEESSDSDDEDEVTKIFRIDTNVFNFKTPTCKAFKEFNYLIQIDPYFLTKYIDGFKTYKEYKDDWMYE
nr:VIER F-box protein 2 [Tanacetum cinerariifolium]